MIFLKSSIILIRKKSNQDFINTCTSDLCHLFISAAKNTFGTRSVYKGKPKIVKGDQFRLQICATKLPKIKTKEKIIPLANYI